MNYLTFDFNSSQPRTLSAIFAFIPPANRIAIKYYQTESQNIYNKYQYHIGNIDYNQQIKNKVGTQYYSVKRIAE
jgi:hypothetical protein